MRTSQFMVLAVSLLTLGCSPSAADDGDTICRIAEEVEANPNPEGSNGAEIARRLESEALTEPIRNAWGAIPNAAPEVRYTVLQAAFAEQGVEDWQCSALERAFTGNR